MSTAAACVRHHAGHAFISFNFFYVFFIHHVVHVEAACVGCPMHDAGRYYFIYLLMNIVPAAAECVRHLVAV